MSGKQVKAEGRLHDTRQSMFRCLRASVAQLGLASPDVDFMRIYPLTDAARIALNTLARHSPRDCFVRCAPPQVNYLTAHTNLMLTRLDNN